MVTCTRCGYQWTSRSALEWVCCPNCHRKFRPGPPEVIVLARSVEGLGDCMVCGRTVRNLNVCKVDGAPTFICSTCLREAGKLDDDAVQEEIAQP
jgi:hypothetical protein